MKCLCSGAPPTDRMNALYATFSRCASGTRSLFSAPDAFGRLGEENMSAASTYGTDLRL